jgi:hypothetical protein
MTPAKSMVALEDMIDSESLSEVLSLIGRVCYVKAEHIRESYSDKELESIWEKAGDALFKLSNKVDV